MEKTKTKKITKRVKRIKIHKINRDNVLRRNLLDLKELLSDRESYRF
jgi:hypothetical protein